MWNLRRRFAVGITGALLAALALVNIAPVGAQVPPTTFPVITTLTTSEETGDARAADADPASDGDQPNAAAAEATAPTPQADDSGDSNG